jgi:hypothetical protein
MKRFVAGEDRSQSTPFPERLDDYVAEDNPVRVIDVFGESIRQCAMNCACRRLVRRQPALCASA